MTKAKGTRGEKKVVSWFEDHGWFAQRTGGSGGGTDRDRGDVMAMRPNQYGRSDVVAVEVKNRGATVRFGKDEIEQLERVGEKTGALSLYVTKPDLRKKEHDHMYAFTSQELKENKKSYSVTNKMIPGPSIQDQIDEYF